MNWLKFLRLQHGWTQEYLAALLKLHVVTVCRIERGWYARPPEGLEIRLQAIFGPEWTFERLMQPVPDLTASPDLEQSARA